MRSRYMMVVPVIVLVFLAFGLAWAAEEKATEEVKHEYVGVKKCKICHKKDGIYESWLATPHATAWDNLSEKDQRNEEFIKYYTTGKTAKGDLLTGVQCEACHGPGADYKKKSIMEDREAAIANGLHMPTEETCKSCHNEKAPPKLAATAKDFDMAKMLKKGVHVLKGMEEEKSE